MDMRMMGFDLGAVWAVCEAGEEEEGCAGEREGKGE